MSRRLAIGSLLTVAAAVVPGRGPEAREGSREIVDASAYGVLADGATDDAAALMRAVAALTNGSVLKLPPGTIALGSVGWPGVLIQRLLHVRIEGNATALKWLARPSQSTAGFGPTGLRLYECQNAVVTGFAIDGNGVDCIGLSLDSCASCIVEGIDAYAHGVAAKAGGGAQFASSKGRNNCWRACVARDATPGSQVRGFWLGNANDGWGDTDLRVDACVARRNSATGFALEAATLVCVNSVSEINGGAGFTSSTAKGSPSSDHLFHGNIARQNAFHGWQTDVYGPNAERIVLAGNLLSENAFSGVYCNKGTDISVLGNLIRANGGTTASPGVAILMSERVTVANNIIEGDAEHGVCIGLNFTSNKVSDVVIAGNQCRGSASKTIWIEAADSSSTLTQIIASGNLINGGSHGIYMAAAAGAIIDNVTLAANMVRQARTSSFTVAEHESGHLTNVRLVGNTGATIEYSPQVRLAEDERNSWNSYRGDGAAAPAGGAWLRGAIVFNSAPAPGSVVGWICTSSGKPGTWHSFGTIGT